MRLHIDVAIRTVAGESSVITVCLQQLNYIRLMRHTGRAAVLYIYYGHGDRWNNLLRSQGWCGMSVPRSSGQLDKFSPSYIVATSGLKVSLVIVHLLSLVGNKFLHLPPQLVPLNSVTPFCSMLKLYNICRLNESKSFLI